ncbi:hypothetical protein SAMN05660479_01428 [Microbulbifer thermotolerans]|nr:hypothetical protein SAMN05660479_01428 [Microbulbifer thermotolerans]
MSKTCNKFVYRIFFATFRFFVAAPLYRKTTLHKKMLVTKALGFRMCNCAELPKSVLDISLSWSFRSIEMEGVNLFTQYFSGLEAEEF